MSSFSTAPESRKLRVRSRKLMDQSFLVTPPGPVTIVALNVTMYRQFVVQFRNHKDHTSNLQPTLFHDKTYVRVSSESTTLESCSRERIGRYE
jgi:hypothetical protein